MIQPAANTAQSASCQNPCGTFHRTSGIGCQKMIKANKARLAICTLVLRSNACGTGPSHQRVLQAEQRDQKDIDERGGRRMQQCAALINCRQRPVGKDLLRAGEEDDEADSERPHDGEGRPGIGETKDGPKRPGPALAPSAPGFFKSECHCSYFGTTPQATRPLPPPFSGWSL
jgi:hypothetical protein